MDTDHDALDNSLSDELSPLTVFSQLCETALEKSGNLLIKILKKIIDNPNKSKYRNLNLIKISNKFQNSKIRIDLIIHLLSSAGFKKSNDGTRLLLNDIPQETELNILRSLHLRISLIMKQNTIQQLINAGYTKNEAKRAIAISLVSDEQNVSAKTPTQNWFKAIVDGALFILNARSNNHTSEVCICGKGLQNVNDSNYNTVYYGGVFGCNICKTVAHKHELYYHCTDFINTRHSYGFDICGHCVNALRNAMSQTNAHLLQTAECDDKEPQCDERGLAPNCGLLKRLIMIMKQYKEDIIDNVNIYEVLNDYIHLIENHSNEFQFEYITNQFGECAIAKCICFARNYRMDTQLRNGENQALKTAHRSILDKIHCHFCHCYDIGSALRMSDRVLLQMHKDATIPKIDDNSVYLVNKQIVRMKQILCTRMQSNNRVFDALSGRLRQRYTQLFTETDEKQDIHKDRNKMYHFGLTFEYEYQDEEKKFRADVIVVKPTYSSLKEELLHNQTSVCARISIGQYHTELQKAIVHQKSAYYAQHYHEQSLPLSNILCILIYCNYDSLQFAFSKTYRKLTPTETLQSVGERHSYFWHLGKCLLESMSSIGVPVMEDSVNSFYHGIGDKLVFPSTANRQFVYGPLSTSSSFAAACVFTNNNNGIIVEFGDDIGFATQLPVGWLSDFTSESEHLFLGGAEGLKFINITIAETGEEYKYVLQALELIHDAINRKTNDDVCRKVQKIAKQLLQCHLQPECDKYVAFNIHAYGAALSDRFFMGIETVHVHCEIIKECYAFLEGVVLDEGLNWIDMEVLIMLFPNVSQIVVEVQNGVDLRPDWLLQIESNLKCIRQSKSEKLNTLRINIDCKRNFNSHFEDNGFQISFQTMQNMNDVCHYVTFELKDESFPCHCF
eukprot:990551_1